MALWVVVGVVFVVAATAFSSRGADSDEVPAARAEEALVSPIGLWNGPNPLAPEPGYYDVSEFFAGRVGVAVFLVESTGSSYDWSDAEVTQTLDGIYAGLAWWAAQDPSARLQFEYELHVREPTTWEPIQNSLNDDWRWIDEIMGNLGYTEADPWARALHFNNDVRARVGTDWAYSIFVADSEDAVNQGRFTNDQYAHGYYGGPWLTMSRYSSWAYNSADYSRVVPAHETGHMFYATDEYDTDPVLFSGYLNCPDNNGAPGIMNRNTLSVSASTRCQIGWVDSDGDEILDVLDEPPETTLMPFDPDPTSERQLTYSGSAQVVALRNLNPFGPRNDVTISRLTGVEFRIDGGTWTGGQAADGTFDGPVEPFQFLTPVLGGGIHAVEARSRNTEGNVDLAPAVDSVTVQLVEMMYTVPADYDTFVLWWRDLEAQNPNYLSMWSPNQAYGLGIVPSSSSHPPYDLWMVKLTNESIPGPKPEVFFMGNPHGDERTGPIGSYWFVHWLLRHARNDTWNTPYDDWLNWLLDHREVYFLVSHNPDGFDRIRRCDATNIDLNREADHDGPEAAGSCPRGASQVFESVQGRTVARFLNDHQIRVGMDLHGGTRALLYPFGSAHASVTGVSPVTGLTWAYAPPDFDFYDTFTHRMGDYMTDYDGMWNGNFGLRNVGTPFGIVGYVAQGTYLSWAYGANTVASPAETPFVDNGPYRGAGAMWITPELSSVKNPPQSYYGGDLTVGYGIDVRNMLLASIEFAQPYVRWHPSGPTATVTVEAGSVANLAWQVNGSLVADDTYLVWSTDPDPVANPQGSSVHQTTYAGQYRGGTGWEGANQGTTNGHVWRETWQVPSTVGTYYVVARAKVDQRYADVLRPDVYGPDSYLRLVKERAMPGWSEDIPGADGLEHMEYREFWDSDVLRVDVVPDTTPPVVTLRFPTDGSVVRAGTRIDFHVTDGNLATTTVSIDGGAAILLPPPWDVNTIGWTDGWHTVNVTATDTGGYAAQRSASFEFDSTPPIIAVVAPQEGSVLAAGSLIDLDVTDAHPGSATWAINGTSYPLAAPFDVDTTGWAEGPVILTVTATDTPGNAATDSFAFVVDASPPIVTLVSPADGSVIRAGTTIDFEVADLSLANATWWDGFGTRPLAAPYDVDTTGWADGPVYIDVAATDTFGRVTTASFTFTIDSTAPVVAMVAPADGSVVTPGTVLDFDVADDNLAAVYFDRGTGWTASYAPFDVDTGAWLDGPYAIRVRAIDAATNEATYAFSVTIDGLPPTVMRTDTGTVERPGHLVTFSITDANAVTATYDLGGGPLPLASPYALDTTTWGDGTFAMAIEAVDAAGNTAILSTSITIDGTPPMVQAVSPGGNTLARPGLVATFAVTDAHLDTVELIVDGLSSALAAPYQVDTAGWADGAHVVDVRATDVAGNLGSVSITITIDGTPPNVGIPIGPIEGVVPVATPIIMSVLVDDANGVADVILHWRFNGGAYATVAMTAQPYGRFSATIPAQPQPGEVDVYVTATDTVGNEGLSEPNTVHVSATPTGGVEVSTWWVLAVVGIVVAILAVMFLFVRRRKRDSP